MSNHDSDLMSYDADYLAKAYAEWDAENTFEDESSFAAVGDLTGKTVIDFGCGTGGFLKGCLERGASDCLGFDLSAPMLQQANEDETIRHLQSIGKLHFQVADLFEPLNHAYGPVDVAISQYVLHHCDCDTKLEHYFDNIYQCLESGGKLFLSMSSALSNLEEQVKVADVCRIVLPLKTGFRRGDPFLAKAPVLFPIKYEHSGEIKKGEPMFHFDNYHWSKEKLIRNLTEAGFVNVRQINTKQLKFERNDRAIQFESLREPMIFLSAEKP